LLAFETESEEDFGEFLERDVECDPGFGAMAAFGNFVTDARETRVDDEITIDSLIFSKFSFPHYISLFWICSPKGVENFNRKFFARAALRHPTPIFKKVVPLRKQDFDIVSIDEGKELQSRENTSGENGQPDETAIDRDQTARKFALI
jgi:hypothetical protein